MSTNVDGSLKVAVIGVGHLGQHHARIYDEFDGVDLGGVRDTDEVQGRKISRRHDTKYVKDFRDLIPEIDAASVVVPTENHYSVGKTLMENEIDCLIEKPMVQNLKEAEKLYQISCDWDVLLQVGHIERFNTAFDAARDYIDNPRYIEVNRLGPFTERSIDIGVVLDLMIHDIDIILSFMDSPLKEIKSVGVSVLSDYEDLTNTRLEFENGCVANLTASRMSMESRREIKVFQDENYVSLDYMDQDVKVWRLKNGKANSMDDVEVYKPHVENGESLKRELAHFTKCIREGREPVVSGNEGRDAIKVGLDVVDAMKQENQLNGIHG